MGLLFNGTTQYVTVASCPVTVTPLTLACWVNQPVIATNTVFFCMGSSIGGDFSSFQISINSAHVDAETSNASGSTDTIAASTVTNVISTTYHICAVFTSTTGRTIYVNGGNAVTDATSSLPTSGSLNTTVIGGQIQGTVGNFVNANIYFPSIWNAALTATDITSLSLGISPRKIQPSHLVSYTRLTGSASPQQDIMRSTGYTLTASPTLVANIRIYSP